MEDKGEFLFIGTNQLDDTKVLFASSRGSDRGSILYHHAFSDNDEYMSMSIANSEKIRLGHNGNISVGTTTIMSDDILYVDGNIQVTNEIRSGDVVFGLSTSNKLTVSNGGISSSLISRVNNTSSSGQFIYYDVTTSLSPSGVDVTTGGSSSSTLTINDTTTYNLIKVNNP